MSDFNTPKDIQTMAQFVTAQEAKRAARQQVEVPESWCIYVKEPTHKGSCLMLCKRNRNLCSCDLYNQGETVYKQCPDYPKEAKV